MAIEPLHVTGHGHGVGNETRVLIEPRVVSSLRYPTESVVVSLPCRYLVTLVVNRPLVVADQFDEVLSL